jgi:hypothetical protein
MIIRASQQEKIAINTQENKAEFVEYAYTQALAAAHDVSPSFALGVPFPQALGREGSWGWLRSQIRDGPAWLESSRRSVK